MDRRAFVKMSASGALLGFAGLAAACTPTAPPASAPAASTKPAPFKLPTYVPAQGPTPDYPGTADGVDPGYVKFPANLSRSVADAPLKGADVTGLVLTTSGLPVPV